MAKGFLRVSIFLIGLIFSTESAFTVSPTRVNRDSAAKLVGRCAIYAMGLGTNNVVSFVRERRKKLVALSLITATAASAIFSFPSIQANLLERDSNVAWKSSLSLRISEKVKLEESKRSPIFEALATLQKKIEMEASNGSEKTSAQLKLLDMFRVTNQSDLDEQRNRLLNLYTSGHTGAARAKDTSIRASPKAIPTRITEFSAPAVTYDLLYSSFDIAAKRGGPWSILLPPQLEFYGTGNEWSEVFIFNTSSFTIVGGYPSPTGGTPAAIAKLNLRANISTTETHDLRVRTLALAMLAQNIIYSRNHPLREWIGSTEAAYTPGGITIFFQGVQFRPSRRLQMLMALDVLAELTKNSPDSLGPNRLTAIFFELRRQLTAIPLPPQK